MIEQIRKDQEKNTAMETNFLLAHNLYARATVPPTDKVWSYCLLIIKTHI